jgi:shikimate dehydrogenase
VLGRPIAHSLSPVLHGAAYRALDLDWMFSAIDVGVDELGPLLDSRGPEWVGFACTMPLKRAVVEVAGTASDRARAVGAGNTLLHRPDGSWAADNTDVAGIVAALRECGVSAVGSVAVLGAGGTAQAAVVALAELGLTGCSVLVRDPARTGEVLEAASRAGVEVEVGALHRPEADLVISTLPPGAADSLAGQVAADALLDVVYAPWPTRLAAAVAAHGGVVVSGALMLLHQAAEQVELMTGRPAPVEAMRAALRAKVPGCGA